MLDLGAERRCVLSCIGYLCVGVGLGVKIYGFVEILVSLNRVSVGCGLQV